MDKGSPTGKQCNFFSFYFLVLTCPKKTCFMTIWRRNFQQVKVTVQAVRGTSTTWKLPTRLSFKKLVNLETLRKIYYALPRERI
jgi:hypothetical protein